MPPKHARSESDSSDEMLRQAKRIAHANHKARTTSTKFTTKVRNAKKADTAERNAEMVQLVHTEEAKLWKQIKIKRSELKRERKKNASRLHVRCPGRNPRIRARAQFLPSIPRFY